MEAENLHVHFSCSLSSAAQSRIRAGSLRWHWCSWGNPSWVTSQSWLTWNRHWTCLALQEDCATSQSLQDLRGRCQVWKLHPRKRIKHQFIRIQTCRFCSTASNIASRGCNWSGYIGVVSPQNTFKGGNQSRNHFIHTNLQRFCDVLLFSNDSQTPLQCLHAHTDR